MDNDELLTVSQVAQRLDISRYRVYRLIQSGDIQAHQARVGNPHYLIPSKALEEYIAAGQAPPSAKSSMMRASEVAMLTGFSTESVRRMCKEGRLPHSRGAGEKGHLRIPRSAVEEFLTGNDWH